MAKIPVLPAREILNALRLAGFAVVSQRGSHVKLRGERGGAVRTVIVPDYPEVSRGMRIAKITSSGWVP